MKMRFMKTAIIILLLPGLMSCTGSNLFKDMSNKNTDQALFDDAQKKLDNGDYTGAINDIDATSISFQEQVNVQESLAGAYAARCGMIFLTFVTNLTSGGGSTFYKTALNGFVGLDTSNINDCLSARNIIQGLGNFSQRTNSENIFLAVLAIAIMGNRLRNDADKTPAPYGDGVVDASFNCGPTQFPIADAATVIEAFSLLLENLTALTASIGTGSTAALSTVASACGASCTNITFAGSSPAETDGAIIVSRALVYMQSIGLGTCNNSNPAMCVCPFP